MLAELMPHGAPEDIFLVVSPPLLRDVQRKLVEKFGYSQQEALHRRFSLATYAFAQVPDFNPDEIDRLAQDRNDDLVVHTALEGRADVLVTNDKALLVHGEGTEYARLDGRSTKAFSLDEFTASIETSNFSIEEIPDVLSLRVGEAPPLSEEV
jgi:predicted nucleic acid-binding protein